MAQTIPGGMELLRTVVPRTFWLAPLLHFFSFFSFFTLPSTITSPLPAERERGRGRLGERKRRQLPAERVLFIYR